ncbi:uncharacterized protein BKCO1_1100061 [Diplodia corticola]|uniref:Uncharacterized protein n=1 Tax=Diplodia corticola TaxID=236234 RepID=A0A1J9SA27_9PEZI|nr:uncharacterized protein BKCO1_1100061 [Diplodia corticola]OJD36429.1 hypothetical protein BKCO1_1100061 [Diplodia corticola]
MTLLFFFFVTPNTLSMVQWSAYIQRIQSENRTTIHTTESTSKTPDMDPTASPWEPPQPRGGATKFACRPRSRQHAQNRNPYLGVPSQDHPWDNQNVRAFRHVLPSREQILGESSGICRKTASFAHVGQANGRVLEPGSLLQVLTSIHPITGECFAFLVQLSQAEQATKPLVRILYWGRGISMDLAMIWLEYQVNWDMHRKLRSVAQVTPVFYEDVWGGM